ncbi:hypothetical protein BKA82DRAFT_825312 [Pisolithus tinctorius]|uniref:Uncharacterized protein n=1 Tax=Pisolithus tinctorius Marx 270 TaxID=870435 RepID=A0A0C3NCN3_PISTI|nr:hypothetical protein BKA82DRAFT_825312 [Pisolithus tinctorius]KIN98859.1 hypothetical protein M404DRAFT_825312 [Pisolithus tinctorius Marx 270]
MINRPTMGVPLVEELKNLVQKPLAEGEKIPIPLRLFASLLSISVEDRCSQDDLSTLFTLGEFPFHLVLVLAAVRDPAPESHTQYDFISFLDKNICHILELLEPSGRMIRNSYEEPMQMIFPTFNFMVNGLCLFQGEEKGPDTMKDPWEELINKLTWTYRPAPYTFGYYCYGSRMTLTAITAPKSNEEKPGLEDIVTIDLRRRKDRIANICHLINLSALLHPLASLMAPPTSH